MRCSQLIKTETRTRKSRSKKTPVVTHEVVTDRVYKEKWLKLIMEERIKYIECGGKIVASIELEYGYGCSCCSGGPDILISYKCERCGHGYFRTLSTDRDEVAKMLTHYIEHMEQPEE